MTNYKLSKKRFKKNKKTRRKIGGGITELIERFKKSKKDVMIEAAGKPALKMKIAPIKSISNFPIHKDKTCSGKWLTVGFIAKGAFGKVYLAKHNVDDVWVAIKESYFENHPESRKTQSIDKTINEINISNNLAKKNISCFIRDAWKTENAIYFASDVMVDRLSNILDDRTLTKKESVQFGNLIKSIGDQNVLYTDIRPDNIMIDGNGDFKIIDWGVNGWELHSPDKQTVPYASGRFIINIVGGKLAGKYLKSAIQMITDKDLDHGEWLNDNIPIPKIAQALYSMSNKDKDKYLNIIKESNEDEDLDIELLEQEIENIKTELVETDTTNNHTDVQQILTSVMLFDFMVIYIWLKHSPPPEEITKIFISCLSKLDPISVKNVWNYTGKKLTTDEGLDYFDIYTYGEPVPKGTYKWLKHMFISISNNFKAKDQKYIKSLVSDLK
jgi:serine/threonine protein kinase